MLRNLPSVAIWLGLPFLGLVVNTIWHKPWADPVAALALIPLILREGWQAMHASRLGCGCSWNPELIQRTLHSCKLSASDESGYSPTLEIGRNEPPPDFKLSIRRLGPNSACDKEALSGYRQEAEITAGSHSPPRYGEEPLAAIPLASGLAPPPAAVVCY